MVWVTWRQHRGEAIAAVGVMLALGAVLILTGLQMRSAYEAQGIGGCLSAVPPPSCSGVVQAYQQQFSLYLGMYQWLNVIPLLFGIFVGAPLVAREVERTTHLLAWTQSVTRTRWITTKVALLAGAAVLAGTVFTLLMTWWRQPLDLIEGGAIQPDAFDLEGIVPVGYFVAALCIGIAAGTLLRRTVPAMGVAITAFLALRFGTIGLLRPNFIAPLLVSSPVGSQPPPAINGAWILSDALHDPAGHSFSGRFAFDQLCAADTNGSKDAVSRCLQQHHILESLTYQPADRFWAFQAIELGLFISVSVALVALSIWWVRRRIS